MIVLVTDFGLEGPYIGQMLRVLHEQAPGRQVINLFADAPMWNPKATAYLLAAYIQGFGSGTVFLCVVDPCVGTHAHTPVVTQCDGLWFVGPDNGLFEMVRRRASQTATWRIAWQPQALSASFHGRDLYAPVAARVAGGDHCGLTVHAPLRFANWPEDLSEIVYIDNYGNAMTGIRAGSISHTAMLQLKGFQLRCARTFASVPQGAPFWYENSNGLVEIAVNQGHAAGVLGLTIGEELRIDDPA